MTFPLYVMKRGASNERTQDEVAADAIYRACGVAVPASSYMVDERGTGWRVAQYVEGKRLGEWMKTAPAAQAAEVARVLRGGFAVDVLLGNDDVIGQTQANVVVDRQGKPWRVDNGWALGGSPGLHLTLRKLMEGAATQSIYGLLTDADIALQVAALDEATMLSSAPHRYHKWLGSRLFKLTTLFPPP